jgi:hypothetical protein
MKRISVYILTLACLTNVLLSQEIKHTTNEMSMTQTIVDKLITPVKLELAKTTILDGRDDSLWNTPEYWEEKELDGVRAIIFYTISDSTKVLDALRLHLVENPTEFKYHIEVSSLLVKIAYVFPDECLEILKELMLEYRPGMKLFDPYGDVIYTRLFEKLPNEKLDELQLNLVDFLNKEDFEFLNYAPMFGILYRKGETSYLEKAVQENKARFEKNDSQGYYSVIIQAIAKVDGFKFYPELLQILKANPNNNNRSKFALYAIQAVARNHKLNSSQKSEMKRDLERTFIAQDVEELLSETIELIQRSE